MGESNHSNLSFSSRERWRACPASVALSGGTPDESSPAAQEGTIAHEMAEWCVRQLAPGFGLETVSTVTAMPTPPVVADLERFRPFRAELEPARGPARTQWLMKYSHAIQAWQGEMRAHGERYKNFILSLLPPENCQERVFITLECQVRARSLETSEGHQLRGTADCIIWCPDESKLIVIDYKYGLGAVEIGLGPIR